MKTALSISLNLALAFSALAATTITPIPYSSEPRATTVVTNDDIILNVTNAGTGTWTTKRATVAKVIEGALPLVTNLFPNVTLASLGGVAKTNPAFYAAGAGRFYMITNGLGIYNGTNNDLTLWSPLSDALAGIVFQGAAAGNYADIHYWPTHGDSSHGELIIESSDTIAITARKIQHQVSNMGYSMIEYYQYDYVPHPSNTNLFGGVPIQYKALCYTNTGGTPVLAGSLDPSSNYLPTLYFDATSTNGSGAWIFYGRGYCPLGTSDGWTFNNEVFRITVGPDAGVKVTGPLTVTGTASATAFAGDGSGLTNLNLPSQTPICGFTNLSSGAAVVLNTNVSPFSIVLLTYGSSDGSLATIGENLSNRAPGVSFKIQSSKTNDTNTVM
jgi:hypothetical protein